MALCQLSGLSQPPGATAGLSKLWGQGSVCPAGGRAGDPSGERGLRPPALLSGLECAGDPPWVRESRCTDQLGAAARGRRAWASLGRSPDSVGLKFFAVHSFLF